MWKLIIIAFTINASGGSQNSVDVEIETFATEDKCRAVMSRIVDMEADYLRDIGFTFSKDVRPRFIRMDCFRG